MTLSLSTRPEQVDALGLSAGLTEPLAVYEAQSSKAEARPALSHAACVGLISRASSFAPTSHVFFHCAACSHSFAASGWRMGAYTGTSVNPNAPAYAVSGRHPGCCYCPRHRCEAGPGGRAGGGGRWQSSALNL